MRQFFPFLLLSLLIGSAGVVAGQQPLRRAKRAPAADTTVIAIPSNPRTPDDSGASLSGLLRVNGMNEGLVGHLRIEAAESLVGPLRIQVSAGGSIVAQPKGDEDGAFEIPLPRGKTQLSVQIKLAKGRNLIEVRDMDRRDEKVLIELVGTDGTDNERVVSAVRTRSVDDREPAKDPVVRSTSGKLAVIGLHTDDQAILDVTVGTLAGPFTISISNENKKVTRMRTKELRRGQTSFVETLPLPGGKYSITVASEDQNETDERVTLGPWTFTGPQKAEEELPEAFRPNDSKTSEKGNLAAAVTRVDGTVNATIHASEKLKGFKIKVVNKDKDDKDVEVDSRSFPDLPRGVEDWSLRLKAGEGENTVTISSMDDSESVELKIPAVALLKPPAEPPTTPQEAVEYDWGRVRGYFAAGMIFSKERDDFSHSDPFLDFTLDKNYVARPWFKIWPDSVDEHGDIRHHYLFKDFNTFFNARLTSIPVTAKDTTKGTSGTGTNATATAEDCDPIDCQTFITSKKAAMMQAGIYLPMYWGFTTWYRRVQRDAKNFRWEKNALFVAPLAKGGILTVTGDRQTAEAQQFGSDDVFNFYSFGAMLGHFRLHARRKLDDYGKPLFYQTGRPVYEANPNIAPELISWLTLSMGRWENFEIEVPTGQKDAMGHDIKVRERPWRYEALGRLKIPETPIIIGFDGNFGKGPDDVRFIFGTRFDIGKIMRTLKAAAAQDTLGQSAPTPTTPTP